MFSLETTHRALLARIETARAAVGAGLRSTNPHSVTLVAASKQQDAGRLAAAIGVGIRHFGENRVQEAAGKWPALRAAHPGLELRLIGPLQTNKAREAVALFDVIETLDRPKLADALAEAMAKTSRRLPCLIQINTGEEAQKAGCLPRELETLYRHATERAGLTVVGLMAVPPADKAPAPHFAWLRQQAESYRLPQLSMGMSGDFETAIAFGATHVRLGTALFGARDA